MVDFDELNSGRPLDIINLSQKSGSYSSWGRGRSNDCVKRGGEGLACVTVDYREGV